MRDCLVMSWCRSGRALRRRTCCERSVLPKGVQKEQDEKDVACCSGHKKALSALLIYHSGYIP